MRVRIHAEVDTDVPPETLRHALLDFSERRLETWSKTLGSFEVHEVGDTWAVVTEANRFPKLWSRERYDWSQQNTISWISQDSNFCTPGSGITMVITPKGAGGSHVAVMWDRTSKNLKGWLWLAGPRVGGERLLRWATRQAIGAAAKARPPSPESRQD